MPKHFAQTCLPSVHGAKGSEFSALAFDHLVFTGSSQTGRQVMRARCRQPNTSDFRAWVVSHLLLLPPIIQSLKRHNGCCFQSTLNAGQTCVAPDYLFVPAGKVDEFVAAAKTIVSGRYSRILNSTDYTSIINDSAYMRLQSVLADAVNLGATSITLLPNSAANAAS